MHSIQPYDFITTQQVCSFKIDRIELTLFKQAILTVMLLNQSGGLVDIKVLQMNGPDYEQWNNDDNYVIDFVFGKLGFSKPVTEDSVTEEPVIQDTVTEDSVIQDTVTEDSVIQDTVTEDSVIQDSVTEDTVIQDSVIQDSVTEDTVIQDSVIQEPVTETAEEPLP